MKKLSILFIQCEMHDWRSARAWSYNLHFGWEEGLKANEVEFLTITTPWISQLKNIVGEQKFDQLWLNDLVLSTARNGGEITEKELAILDTLAPIRVGFLTESIYDYSEEEMAEMPSLKKTQAQVEKCLPHLTHVMAFDEQDVMEIEKRHNLPCMWSPSPVVSSLIYEQLPAPTYNQALFSGSVYRGRLKWLKYPILQNCLSLKKNPDRQTLQGKTFDLLHKQKTRDLMKIPLAIPFYPLYINYLRYIRRKNYLNWLNSLQSGLAVVNLPHFVKSYTPRVIEGMAAGRPVLSWEIPDRPQNKAIFESGKEILLFNTPDELAEQIERLQSDNTFAQTITENARRRIREFHTTDKRVEQILNWIETGKVPSYH